MSFSLDKNVALQFMKNKKPTEEKIRVLYILKSEPGLNTKSATNADLNGISFYEDEREILLFPFSVYEISTFVYKENYYEIYLNYLGKYKELFNFKNQTDLYNSLFNSKFIKELELVGLSTPIWLAKKSLCKITVLGVDSKNLFMNYYRNIMGNKKKRCIMNIRVPKNNLDKFEMKYMNMSIGPMKKNNMISHMIMNIGNMNNMNNNSHMNMMEGPMNNMNMMIGPMNMNNNIGRMNPDDQNYIICSGFCCLIPLENKNKKIPVLITCIKKETLIAVKQISIQYDNGNQKFQMNLTDSSKIYSNDTYGITIIEMENNNEKFNQLIFMDIDEDIFNSKDFLM